MKKNPYFGRNNFSTQYQKGFEYKDVMDYTLPEWMENIFFKPEENVAIPNKGYFMDKRLGHTYSLMKTDFEDSRYHEFMGDTQLARQFAEQYWRKAHKNFKPIKYTELV